ncbi:MAG: twin-arginine translocation signal domain-containing protein [Chloroflexota bacterium]|nr:twin-arginine translocation signal domain-containing protein [Chloroflexota bacterium]
MIDRRTFLARSSVATALATVGIRPGGAQASPTALPAPIPITSTVEVVEDDAQDAEAFEGFWSTYDQVNNRFLANHIALWAERDRCGMTAGGINADIPGERIEFEDPKIVWAITCMMRLMRKQGLPPD